MKRTVATKADLKAKSGELQIPFSNLLAGYILETLMYLISKSEFAGCLWLKNEKVLGDRKHYTKNILTLNFAYITNEKVIAKGMLQPGQKLSLKFAYLILLGFIEKDKVPEIKWRGKAELIENGAEFEIIGEFEEMSVPIHIRLEELAVDDSWRPENGVITSIIGEDEITYLKYPTEHLLAEKLCCILKNMELIPEMEAYFDVYLILEKELVDGRHIREVLEKLCYENHVALQEERVVELVSYKNYSYMKKRWGKYLRHCGKTEPSWEEVVDKIDVFLTKIWYAICSEEVFFGDWMPDLGRFLD